MGSKLKCLVIGYGSIGRRHARVLDDLGHRIALVSRAKDVDRPRFESISEGIEKWSPDYVVVANDTGLHAATLTQLNQVDFGGITLVEKPLFANSEDFDQKPDGPIFVGYGLRFHPVIHRISEILGDDPIWTLSAYVGQYLPDWRPERDYRHSYSARSEDGGVIRDLAHELDYALLLAGKWQRTVVAGGQISSLEINSEDAVSILVECERCPLVTLHLNYLDRIASRWVLINGPAGTIKANMLNGHLVTVDGEESILIERDEMIRNQHLAVISGEERYLCNFEDALCTQRLIDAAHESIQKSCWVIA